MVDFIMEFQSHAGSIEAIMNATRFVWVIEFQSHAGSIEALNAVAIK